MQRKIWGQIDIKLVTLLLILIYNILYIIIIKYGQFFIKLEQKAGAQSTQD